MKKLTIILMAILCAFTLTFALISNKSAVTKASSSVTVTEVQVSDFNKKAWIKMPDGCSTNALLISYLNTNESTRYVTENAYFICGFNRYSGTYSTIRYDSNMPTFSPYVDKNAGQLQNEINGGAKCYIFGGFFDSTDVVGNKKERFKSITINEDHIDSDHYKYYATSYDFSGGSNEAIICDYFEDTDTYAVVSAVNQGFCAYGTEYTLKEINKMFKKGYTFHVIGTYETEEVGFLPFIKRIYNCFIDWIRQLFSSL